MGAEPSQEKAVVTTGPSRAGGEGDQTSHSRPLISPRLLLGEKMNPFPAVSPLPKISSVGSKGEFLLVSEHVIELLTKICRATLDATQMQLPVTVTEE